MAGNICMMENKKEQKGANVKELGYVFVEQITRFL